ncbi:MAG: hypothetical protein ACJA1C_003297 [Crocinitomicaceae bacterium]
MVFIREAIKITERKTEFMKNKTFLYTLLSLFLLLGSKNTSIAQDFAPPVSNPFSLSTSGSDEHSITVVDLDGDGDFDILDHDYSNGFHYYENIGTATAPNYAPYISNPFSITNIPNYYGTPRFVDLDNDSDMDLMVGADNGNFYYYENIGTAVVPNFGSIQTNPFSLTDISNSSPTFGDIDNDGDLDLLSGEYDGDFYYYENVGTASVPSFSAYQVNPFGLTQTLNDYSHPTFVDLDGDGDLDIMAGDDDEPYYYYKNIGSANVPNYAAFQINPFSIEDNSDYLARPSFCDLDNDGDLDMISGAYYSEFNYYENNPLAYGTDIVTTCSNYYTWVDGITYVADNSEATDTLVGAAANGGDSVVTLNLSLMQSAIGIDIQTACAQFTWVDGNVYASSNNTATYTIGGGAANGCDSVVTLDLTIINGTSGIDTRTECDALVWLDGNTYSSDNNSVTYIIAGGAANGCDSLVTLDLTIVNSSSSTDVIDACGSYTWMDGNTYTASTTTTHIVPNAVGCDSTITLDLTINTVDASVINASPTLTANETEATFQWIDCDNGNTAIAGETGQAFTSTVNGNYAVIVTGVNCSDTSACELVNNVGIDELKDAELIIYPNPTNDGRFTVRYSGIIEQITLVDIAGRTVNVLTDLSTGNVDATALETGKYFILIQTDNGQVIKSIVVSK